jgi:hypothetical protein
MAKAFDPTRFTMASIPKILKEKKYNSFGSLRAYLLIVAWLKEEKHSSELELLQANIQDVLEEFPVLPVLRSDRMAPLFDYRTNSMSLHSRSLTLGL